MNTAYAKGAGICLLLFFYISPKAAYRAVLLQTC